MFKVIEVPFAPACVLLLALLTFAACATVSIVDNTLLHEPHDEQIYWIQSDGTKVYPGDSAAPLLR